MDREKAMEIIGEAGFDIWGPRMMETYTNEKGEKMVRFVRPTKPTWVGEKLINLVNLVEDRVIEGMVMVRERRGGNDSTP